jgi:exopolysaccharide production protein ExoY
MASVRGHVAGGPAAEALASNESDAAQVIGRVFDVVVAVLGIIFLLPLLIVIGVLVFAFDPGPIVFAHRRVGRGGKLFNCYKFRSMATNSAERLKELLETDEAARAEWALNHKLVNDPRITGIGGFLRKSSLDELPQLFNVLTGDMSFVGPRPIVEAEAEKYGRYFETYCRVRPGITGLWQISGRSLTSYRRRVVLDVAYVRSKSLTLDLKILFYTVPSVLLVRGAH